MKLCGLRTPVILGFCLSLACSLPGIGWAQETSQAASSPVDFQLQDFRGKTWKLSEFADRSAVVLVFLGTECPLAVTYSLRLQELADAYAARGVQFVAIDSNVQDSLEKMAAFARRQKLEIPFLKDPDGELALRLGATRTPEAFLLNAARNVVYQGRIDDQHGIGYLKNAPQSRELEAALESTLKGEAVEVSRTDPIGCLIGRKRTATAATNVTYASHVAAILNNRCVRCHRADQIGPFRLDNHSDAAAWSEMIAEVVQERRMPPWHANSAFGKFANDCSLSPDEERTLLEWVAAGAPAGDLASAPHPPAFPVGWQLPQEPDYVCNVTPKPYSVPAKGEVAYKFFVVDPKFEEDKWVESAELRPGHLGVVHHILCFLLPPGARELEQELDGFLVGYVPGMLPPAFPKGYAKRIPAGSKFVFQVHYTPNGQPQKDQSRLGIVFAEESDVTHEIVTTCAVNPKFEIPPQEAAHRVKARNRVPLGDWPLMGMMPHMHLRGKSFRYEAVYPDGRREVLLDVPRFDFNWQTSYQLQDPLPLPARTRIECVGVFDNSAANLSNPDPTRTVRWGDQTWEEMMIGYFDVAIPKKEAEQVRSRLLQR